jgi:hypothetical protein
LKTAVAKDQVLSRRSGHNVTAWRNLLLEHDAPKGANVVEHAEMWAGFVAQLPLPLVSFTCSGAESIHALFRISDGGERWWNRNRDTIAKYAVKYGADPNATRAVQLTRLGNCMRGVNNQHLLYLDADPDWDSPIANRAEFVAR